MVPSENNSLKNFNLLAEACYGITWHSFDLNIYNQATTRKRLLTQGSTTYETIDFETSQNLLIMTDNNATQSPKITFPTEFKPPGHKYEGSDLQDSCFFQNLQELATGTTKHFHFEPETLPNYQVWQLLSIESGGVHANKMFPARQHTNGIQQNDMPLVTQTLKGFNSMDIT